jgi:hypothetical protein
MLCAAFPLNWRPVLQLHLGWSSALSSRRKFLEQIMNSVLLNPLFSWPRCDNVLWIGCATSKRLGYWKRTLSRPKLHKRILVLLCNVPLQKVEQLRANVWRPCLDVKRIYRCNFTAVWGQSCSWYMLVWFLVWTPHMLAILNFTQAIVRGMQHKSSTKRLLIPSVTGEVMPTNG